jgi:molybdopterin-guanine dinucleotide biosynthesis protein A
MTDGRNSSQLGAVVLAGGCSSRLGRDKAFLRVNGQFLIERIVDRLAQLSDEVIIVANEANKYEQFEAVIVGDAYPGKGALGGIYSGLTAATSSHCLVVACDMPFLDLSLLRYMHGLASEYDVVIPRIGKLTEALHAIYSRDCLPFIDDLLQAGDLRIVNFFSHVRVRYVDRDEVDIFDPEHLSFFNINSQADLMRARDIWAGERSGNALPGAARGGHLLRARG